MTHSFSTGRPGRPRGIGFGMWLFPGAILIIPAIVWFVKVQGALNRYWAGTAPAPGP